MTASFTDEEFAKYVHGLPMLDLEGVVGFIQPYVADLEKKMNGKDTDAFRKAYTRYSIVMAEFGVVLLKAAEEIIEHKEKALSIVKKMSDEMEKLKAQSAA